MNKALIVIAHGSRKKETQDELKLLVEQLVQLESSYQTIEYAFLELSEPDLVTVIRKLHAQEIESINIFPYFLNAGRHVNEDIPQLVQAAQEQFPTMKIELLRHFGTSPDIPKWILGLC